jgi:hypothetical protein
MWPSNSSTQRESLSNRASHVVSRSGDGLIQEKEAQVWSVLDSFEVQLLRWPASGQMLQFLTREMAQAFIDFNLDEEHRFLPEAGSRCSSHHGTQGLDWLERPSLGLPTRIDPGKGGLDVVDIR